MNAWRTGADIHAGRVLRGENGEIRMTLDHFLCAWNHELAVIVQKSIQHLKNFRRGKIELVECDPMPFLTAVTTSVRAGCCESLLQPPRTQFFSNSRILQGGNSTGT